MLGIVGLLVSAPFLTSFSPDGRLFFRTNFAIADWALDFASFIFNSWLNVYYICTFYSNSGPNVHFLVVSLKFSLRFFSFHSQS